MKFNINTAIDYQHMPIMFTNEHKTSFVAYAQFDMGAKYKVYIVREEYKRPNFENSFTNLIEAVNYCKKIF